MMMVVWSMKSALLNLNALDWTLPVLPAAILMLAVALKFSRSEQGGKIAFRFPNRHVDIASDRCGG